MFKNLFHVYEDITSKFHFFCFKQTNKSIKVSNQDYCCYSLTVLGGFGGLDEGQQISAELW